MKASAETKERPKMIESPDGYRAWYQDGQLHREDGPAIEYPNGTRMWYLNGRLHREDGPAVEDANGNREWWIRGQELTEQEFNNYRFLKWLKQGRLIGRENQSSSSETISKIKRTEYDKIA